MGRIRRSSSPGGRRNVYSGVVCRGVVWCGVVLRVCVCVCVCVCGACCVGSMWYKVEAA